MGSITHPGVKGKPFGPIMVRGDLAGHMHKFLAPLTVSSVKVVHLGIV